MKSDNLSLKIDEGTLYGMFHSRALRHGEKGCLRFKKEGSYQTLSWSEVDERVLNLAGYLLSQGCEKGDRIALLSPNRPEWAITDLATLAIGCITVPIYPTLTPKAIEILLADSEAKILVAQEAVLVEALPHWKGGAISFEEPSFSKRLQEGKVFRQKEEVLFSRRLQETHKGDIVTLIYTSGTTGDSKGVMLSHDNFLSNCRSCSEAIPISGEDVYLSYLPLSHVFERMAGFYLILFRGAQIAYAENMETVFNNMQEVKPTLMSGVPRFFEKVHEAIFTSVQKFPLPKQKLFLWAVAVGRDKARARHKGEFLPWRLRLKGVLASLVLSGLRRKIGRQLRFFISGSAPLSVDLIEFFAAFGCVILEGYGLTETSPVISVNRLGRQKWGSVGLPIRDVEVKIAEDGEILVRGPNVMQGYFRKEEATREVFRDGYLLTGDIGTLDEEGYLFITDRKKDLIKTSGGKFVAPQKLEGLLKSDAFIDEAVVFGDRQKFIVALLVPNFKRLENYCAERGLVGQDREALLTHPEVVSLFQERIDARLSDLASYEKVKKFALLEKELTIQEGELTPTLKVKRKHLYERYHALIDSLYQENPKSP